MDEQKEVTAETAVISLSNVVKKHNDEIKAMAQLISSLTVADGPPADEVPAGTLGEAEDEGKR